MKQAVDMILEELDEHAPGLAATVMIDLLPEIDSRQLLQRVDVDYASEPAAGAETVFKSVSQHAKKTLF